MADQTNSGPTELGAEMDYQEHEKTYSLFLTLTKYGALHVATLLIAMAFAFFGGFGFISATILFVLLTALGIYLLR
ncbi:MAG: aa3-type cytochrome c oxidase subunit IV [Rhizobiaceae bacterium]|nr:aa3-type cytochrome c oxidase subunit IV [Rhizobiaceae bacterium]MCV0408469.1 aa3-type cytochrome c oxidase subunit IV [Rhizobiaceae bacterium]